MPDVVLGHRMRPTNHADHFGQFERIGHVTIITLTQPDHVAKITQHASDQFIIGSLHQIRPVDAAGEAADQGRTFGGTPVEFVTGEAGRDHVASLRGRYHHAETVHRSRNMGIADAQAHHRRRSVLDRSKITHDRRGVDTARRTKIAAIDQFGNLCRRSTQHHATASDVTLRRTIGSVFENQSP